MTSDVMMPEQQIKWLSHVFLMLLEYLSWLSQYDRSEIKKFLQVGVSENVGINLW